MTKSILQMKWVGIIALFAVAFVMSASAISAQAAAPSVNVTIVKMIDGTEATPTSANNTSFPMTATWSDPTGIGTGTGSFNLSPDTDPSYEAVTSQLQQGATYSASEDTGSAVGTDCSADQAYRLAGYTTGHSREQAEHATMTQTPPVLTDIHDNQYILVWNVTCVNMSAPMPVSPANGSTNTTAGQTSVDWTDVTSSAGGVTYVYQASNSALTNPDGSFTTPVYTSGPLTESMIATPGTPEGTYYWHAMATDGNDNMSPWSTTWSFTVDNSTSTPVATTTEQVHITKYIDGVQATAQNASSTNFTMNASWNDSQIGSGSGTYTLGAPTYQTQTIPLQNGSDYSTSEVTGTNVGATCAAGLPYALDGYTTGSTMQEAASSTATTTAPAFTNLQSDKYVIVWNKTCANGTIEGTVTNEGRLAVTSIDAVDTTATADNSYEHGWLYVFHVTLPSNEPGLAMKFSDWMSASSTIPVAGNMRISSSQANNGGATITITAANVYTSPDLHMTTDLDPSTPGIQVEVRVEVKIPTGTPDASYTTNYGVRSE